MNNSFMLPSVVIILLILCLTFLATLHMVLTHRADAAAAAAAAAARADATARGPLAEPN